MRRFRIGISGSYGGVNLGDEAILAAIVAGLRASVPAEIVAFTRDPADTLRRHRVDRAIPLGKLTRTETVGEMRGLDVFVLGGGGILFDANVPLFLRDVALAQELGVPVVVYSIGAGPLREPANRALVKQTFEKAAVVTVRDHRVLFLLEELDITRHVEVTADPALLLEPEPLPEDALAREGLARHGRLVGFSAREPGPAAPDLGSRDYHTLLSNAADFMVDRLGAEIVFVPMERMHRDMQHSHAIIARMDQPQRATVLRGDYTPGQLLSLMGQLEFGVGMRLHFLLLAASAGVPVVALPYEAKITGLLDELALDVPPPLSANAGRLIAYIDRSWDGRNRIRAHVGERLPLLRGRARRANELLLEVLRAAS